MKLRLLNASHSVMAYLGYLAGHETIADTIADPVFLRLVEGLMDVEVTPTLKLPAGTDVAAYKRALIERFANPALKHRTWQIAMDGSQKLPQRLLGTVRDRLAANAPFDRLALGVAGWMRYVTGSNERGQPIDVRDPLAERLRTIAGNAGPNAARLAPMLLEVREVFGELAADTRFRDAVTAALGLVLEKGARGAVAAS
jgi:fructuronate reductase